MIGDQMVIEMRLKREDYPTNWEYFFHLFNDLGCRELRLAICFGNSWTRWVPFEEIIHTDPDDHISLYSNGSGAMPVREFVKRANNRSVLDIEVLIDVDSVDGVSDPKTLQAKARQIMKKLGEHDITYEAYSTGGKGVHISVIIPELRNMDHSRCLSYKYRILQKFGGDMLKASSRTMISVEGMPHRKTKKRKVRFI